MSLNKRGLPRPFGYFKASFYEPKGRGSILIVSIWILMILSLLAIGLGFRSSIELKLAGFHLSASKALSAAKGAIIAAIGAKQREYIEGKSLQIDALSEGWSENEDRLKDMNLGGCTVNVRYAFRESVSSEPVTFYGMQDEHARININKASFETINGLIAIFLDDEDKAPEVAGNIIDWRDEDDTPTEDGKGHIVGLEDYSALDKGYNPKNRLFDTVEELLLVEGMTDELLRSIRDFVTVYGDGTLNINTASQVCLDALFGAEYPRLGEKVVSWRDGVDGEPGTRDDRWFTKGPITLIEKEDGGMVAVKNLDDEQWLDPFAGVTSREWKRIKAVEDNLTTSSGIYRIEVESSIRNVTKEVETVVEFEGGEGEAAAGGEVAEKRRSFSYLEWREN